MPASKSLRSALHAVLNALHLSLLGGLDIVLCSSHSRFNCPVGVQPSTWGSVKRLYL